MGTGYTHFTIERSLRHCIIPSIGFRSAQPPPDSEFYAQYPSQARSGQRDLRPGQVELRIAEA